MAGGRGLRLQALTENTPKPMIEVGDRPMLESLIHRFRDQGFRKIWLTVHYRYEVIEQYFGDGSKHGVKIKYIREEEPLGTGGGLKLLPEFEVPFIVMNADVWAPELKFTELMRTHGEKQPKATIALARYQHQVPYGVARVDQDTGLIRSMDEKPIENFYVNAGLYVLEPDVLNKAPNGAWDMPELIKRLDNVAAFPIHTQWWDLGSFTDLTNARAEWNNGR